METTEKIRDFDEEIAEQRLIIKHAEEAIGDAKREIVDAHEKIMSLKYEREIAQKGANHE